MARITYRARDSIYSPAEAERIAGLPTATQRSLRYRGVLPSRSGGTPGFESRQLAAILAMRRLMGHGLTLEKAYTLGSEAAPSVLWHAIEQGESKAWQVLGMEGQRKAFDETLRKAERGKAGVDYIAHMVGCDRKEVHDYLLLFPDHHEWCTDLEQRLFEVRGDVTICNLIDYGAELEKAARPVRPLITVTDVRIGGAPLAHQKPEKASHTIGRKRRASRPRAS